MSENAKESKETTKKFSRFFACVSYIPDTDKVIELIQQHSKSIRAFAVIKHDRDETDAHHHFVIRTFSSWECLKVANWFKDDSGQNTFAQPVHDRQAIIDYLTHEGEFSEETGKHHYDKSEIIDGGLSDLLPKEDCLDDTDEIIEHLLNGTPFRQLVKMYGRSFVFHYAQYALIAQKISEQEGGNRFDR